MRGTHRSVVAGFCTVVLVCSLVGSAVAVQPSMGEERTQSTVTESTATLTQSSSDDTIDQTQTYALVPDEPGEVAVTLTYDIPDRVTELETTLPENSTVTDTDGFDSVGDSTYEWDESTATATIELRYNPNETTDRTGREAAAGDYLFVDTGDWALFRRIQTAASWSYTQSSGQDPVTFQRAATTDGPGATGNRFVYLGEVSTVERTANGQTFRLVVPERADLEESTDEILDSMVNASTAFDVGYRDEEVFMLAAPTDEIQWGVRGLESGGSDFYVRDFERLDEPSNVWLHEYVHTRQSFSTTSETRWLTEGTAVYYAALLTLEQERITFDEFSNFIDDGERSTYSDVVLSDPGTWAQNSNYVKGPLVAGRIDVAMRDETAQTGTFEETMGALNDVDGQVTQDAFLDAVEDSGGPASRSTAVDYTETTATVTMWNSSTHERLFGPLPADVGYGLPNETDGYRVSGDYRNGTVEPPITLATGETLTVDTVVRNDGGTEGEYNATLAVNGSVVASETGTIAADDEQVVPLSYTFEEAGTYTVAAGAETVTVTVEAPAEPTVETVSVATDRLQQGENTTVTATVRNDAAVPANGTVVFTRDGEPVASEVVTLGPGNSTNVSVSVVFPETGDIQVAAGSADPVTVTVVTPTASPTTTGGDGPGFTALGALVAVVLALLVRRR